MKKSRKFLLSSLMMLTVGLVGCGENSPETAKSASDQTTAAPATETSATDATTSVIKEVKANSATVEMKIGESVGANTLYTITPVKGSLTAAQKKVTVTSSDTKVVEVKSSKLRCIAVGESTITVTSAVDTTKSCTFKITVGDVYFDRSLTNYNAADDFSHEMPEDGGYVRTSGVNTDDLFIKSEQSTKFMVSVTIQVHSVLDSENFPKFGIVTSTGTNQADDETTNNRMYFFMDMNNAHTSTEWDAFGLCEVQNGSNWAWNAGVTNAMARHIDAMYTAPTKIKLEDEFSMTLIRDGLNFHCFVNDAYAGSAQGKFDLYGYTDKETKEEKAIPMNFGFFEFNSDATFSKYSYELDATKVDEKIASIGDALHYVADSEWAAD